MTRTRQRKSPEWLARGGRQLGGTALLSTRPLYTQTAPLVKQVTRLADLRRQYNQAVLAERWADARRLQREYHAAERERRRELLQQAAARGRRHE